MNHATRKTRGDAGEKLKNVATLSLTGSREKLLRAAERLIATSGFRSASVRQIAATAGLNSALVGYYFGSKDRLLTELHETHFRPLFSERLRRLTQITANGRQPDVKEIVDAWFLVWLPISHNTEDMTALYYQLSEEFIATQSDPNVNLWRETQDAVTEAFVDALHRCLPHLSRETLIWRFHFALSGIPFVWGRRPKMIRISHGKCDPNDAETCIRELISFVTAGFSAPEKMGNGGLPSIAKSVKGAVLKSRKPRRNSGR